MKPQFVPSALVLFVVSLFPGTVCYGQPPSILPNGVVPVYSTSNTIQPGEWISIYGINLASATLSWNADYPTILAGTTVTINGRKAYLSYVSPGLVNAQAPDDTASGPVPVTLTTSNGTANATVTLGNFAPSFSLLDGKHVAGILLRFDGSGAYGNGTYDILGPTGTALGYKTVAAKPGDTLALFGVGFGPTRPFVPAGAPFAGSAPMTSTLQLLIGNVPVTPSFAGLSGAGLFQFNVTVPAGMGTGDVPLVAMVGGLSTPAGAVVSLQAPVAPAPFVDLSSSVLFQPDGYPNAQHTIDIQPNGDGTFYGTIDGTAGIVFPKGISSNLGQTIVFLNPLLPGSFNYSGTALTVTGASLTVNLQQTSTVAGNLSGTLSINATRFFPGGSIMTFSGPVSGVYSSKTQ